MGLGGIAAASVGYQASAAGEAPVLNPKKFNDFRVDEIKRYNYNTNIYTFKNVSAPAKLPVASFVVAKGPAGADGKAMYRPYTPIGFENGVLTLLVKVYPNGNVSKYFGDLKPGDMVTMKGPLKKLEYNSNMKRQIGMVAGGSGITPMMQIIKEVLKNPTDKTQVHLVYCNVTEEDILLREELSALSNQHENFTVHHILEKPTESWRGLEGRITRDYASQLLPPPSDENLILICGPPGFMKAVSGDKTKDRKQGEVEGMLKDLGYNIDQVFKF